MNFEQWEEYEKETIERAKLKWKTAREAVKPIEDKLKKIS